MGGNALVESHGIKSERMNKKVYTELENYIVSILTKLGVNFRTVKYYHEKDDFGDLDIVVSREDNAVSKIRKFFHEHNIKHTNEFREDQNVSIFSALFNGDRHQVDFMFVDKPELQSASEYYSYNDIWNLLGKIIKTYDYKLGWNGLLYTYRNGNHYKEDIVLTYNLLTALEILGLDWKRYQKGFKNYDEMFEYVTSCKAFDKSKFALENLNHRNRVRDRKRKTYNLFLQYIEDKDYGNDVIPLPHPTKVFPLLSAKIRSLDNKFKDKNRAKEIINGNIVRNVTGLDGKDINKILTTFRVRYDVDAILKMKPELVESHIKEIVKELGL